ncbi:RP439 family protein [Rickettsia asembonensis]|uniref:Uncharacterized protein n=1 Tax=Rickettsia asembonensis TaxID=1068590 RepID=A0A0C2MMU1_9RICK|nr:hypothetical protein [Rickettsia asembonensis]KIJ88501.1 hypothetical protein SB78_05335 [Rickettsia asembonensis]
MQDFKINSKSVLHMLAQIRAKQLAIRDGQNKEQDAIVKAWEENGIDKSGGITGKEIIQALEDFYNTSKSVNNYLKKQDINDIGYPIKFNKTDLQLKMALNYAKQQEDNLIDQIIKGKFYSGLSNEINSNELPVLQSDSTVSFWGNENSSVSSVLLESIAQILDIEPISLVGAATGYKFYNSQYELPKELIPEDYHFVGEKGMLLFGDYQYGGHRYFKDQLVFGPEDCSSSVGKATYLPTEQIKSITTAQMRENYSKYGYELVATLNDIDQKQLELIEPGDIYLYKTHCAIIATKPENTAEITTLQFSRDIDREEKKLLGGGIYNYKLRDKVEEDSISPIYILRAKNLEPLHAESSLPYFLSKIDAEYINLYPEGPSEEVVGDCRMFFEIQEQA